MRHWPRRNPVEIEMVTITKRLIESMPSTKLQYLRRRFLTAWTILVIFQLSCWLNTQNTITAALILAGGIVGTSMTARIALLRSYPISTLILLGYTLSYFLLPPFATLIEWKPVTNNLIHPELIYVHALVCLLFLLGAHVIYRNSYFARSLRTFMANRVYAPLGYFRPLGNAQLMIMGGIGLLAMAYQIFVAGSAREEVLGADSKFMLALFPLVYMPYCLLVRPVLGDVAARVPLSWKLALAAYTVPLVLVSMASNSRSAVLLGVSSIFIAYLYGIAVRLIPGRIFRSRNLILAAIALLLVQGPIADMATSMVIVRSERSDLAASELLEATMNTFQNKRALEERRQLDGVKNYDWDEYYVGNVFLARLSNLKFADASLDLALRQDASAKTLLRNLEWQNVLGVFPQPLIDALGLPVDKDLVKASGGDLMLFTTTGDYDALRGFRTGSIFGNGYAMFNWLYPFMLALAAILIFALADAQTTRIRNPDPASRAGHWVPVMNSLTVARLFAWFFFLTSAATGVESMFALSHYILRGWVEALFIYLFAYWLSCAILRLVTWRPGKRRRIC